MLISRVLVVLLIVAAAPASPFQYQSCIVNNRHNYRALSSLAPTTRIRTKTGSTAGAGIYSSHVQLLLAAMESNNGDNGNDDDDDDESQVKQHSHSVLSLLFAAAGCFCGSYPHIAEAVILSESPVMTSVTYNLQQQQQHSISSSLLVATYASEGSGGLPFLSTFQTPGAVPKDAATYSDNNSNNGITNDKNDREARNRAYDEAFDQDKRDRDAYYAKMAIQSREKKMNEMKARRAEIGLDGIDAGPRYGDEDVASLASLKEALKKEDPVSTTPSAANQQLQQQKEESPAAAPATAAGPQEYSI